MTTSQRKSQKYSQASTYSADAKLERQSHQVCDPDRNIFHHIIVSMESSREVNMGGLLSKEHLQ